MKSYINYNSGEIRFILIFYKILIAFAVIFLLALFILPINDSVKSNVGEIISKTPQKDYLVPFEAKLNSILVKEGDFIKKGDTLIIITNELIDQDIFSKNIDIKNIEQNQISISQSVSNLKRKLKYMKRELVVLGKQYLVDKKKNKNQINALTREFDYLSKKLISAKEKLKMDSTLYKTEVISKREMANSDETYLTVQSEYNSSRKNLNEVKLSPSITRNTYLKNKNTLKRQIVDLENDIVYKKEQRNINKNSLSNSEVILEHFDSENSKQYIIADFDGTVHNVYSQKKSANILKKNDLLLSISPVDNEFYGKITLKQKDLWKLKAGQDVNMKIDAYYYYEHGITKGKISYLSQRTDDNSEFHALVEFNKDEKLEKMRSGYSMNSEIIIEKLKLWKYIYKKIFRKLRSSN